VKLRGTVDFIGDAEREYPLDEATRILAARPLRDDLQPDALLPADTRLWAALQRLSGGTWGGCVYDVESILAALPELGS
jgi:hypothetical protein